MQRKSHLYAAGKKVVLCTVASPEDFLMQAKSENAHVFEISAHGKDPRVVKIISERGSAARLISCAASSRKTS